MSIAAVGALAPLTEESCTISGTSGDITLNGAETGRFAYAQTCAAGKAVTYVVQRGAAFECWRGVYQTAPARLTRVTLVWSFQSPYTAAYSWPSGTATVRMVPNYADMVAVDYSTGKATLSAPTTPYLSVTDGTRTVNVGVDSANATLSTFLNASNGARLLANSGTVTALSYDSSGNVSLGGPAGAEGLRVVPVTSAVNRIEAYGSGAGGIPYVSTAGADSTIPLYFIAKGGTNIGFQTNTASNPQVVITHTASANRYITLTGSNGGTPTIGTSGGDLALSGADAVRIAAGGVSGTSTAGAITFGNDPGRVTGAVITFFGSTHATLANRMYLYGSGGYYFVNAGTTAAAANAVIDAGSSNSLLRSTSTRAAKNLIAPMTLDDARQTLGLQPWFYTSKSLADDPNRLFAGFVAEDADEAGLAWLPTYGADGKPTWFQYERMSTAHHLLINDLITRVVALEARAA